MKYFSIKLVVSDNENHIELGEVQSGQKPESALVETENADYYTYFFSTEQERAEQLAGIISILNDTNTIGKIIGANRVELGETKNGYCYKDYAAYKSGSGIAYIPEHGLIEGSSAEFDTSYTRSDIENCVRDHLKAIDFYESEEQVQNIALSVFEILDWQFVETLLLDMDI